MAKLRTPKSISPLGFGTWKMGGIREPDPTHDVEELHAINYALDHGLNVLDTAELYGKGHAEELVARGLHGRDRESIHLTSKVLPDHLDPDQLVKAAHASLRRLGTPYVDLYLIHWPPEDLKKIGPAIRAMEDLVKEGKVRSIGVSNFDVAEMKLAMEATSREEIVANQVPYSLLDRTVEKEVVPFCEKEGITVIAYTPLGRGHVAEVPIIQEVARKRGKTPIQVALNYLLPHSLPIPKAVQIGHIDDILGAVGWELTTAECERLRRETPERVG